MAEDKPCISELYKSGGLDMELVGKIAHNELDKRKGFPFSSVSASSIRALASDYIDSYAGDQGIIEAFAVELDSQLSTEDYRGGESITFNAELEVEKIDLKQGEQGLDDIYDLKNEEASLVANGSEVEYGAASNEQSK